MTSLGRLFLFSCFFNIAIAGLAHAESYPDKPIRVTVAFTAGGSTDIVAREFAHRLEEQLKQPVVIENKPGANGNIGTQYVAKGASDGYTLLVGNMGPISVNPTLLPQMKFDPLKHLTAISPLAEAPNVLVIHPSIPASSFSEFIKWVKAQPADSVSYGSTGIGTAAHLSGFMLQKHSNVPMLHVPYKGSGALTDVVAGRVQFMVATAPSVVSLVKAGKLRALLITGTERSPALPDAPTAAESGLGDILVSAWFGFFGPPDMPQPIIKKLNKVTTALLKTPEFQSKVQSLGANLAEPMSPSAYKEFIGRELKKMKSIVTEMGAIAE